MLRLTTCFLITSFLFIGNSLFRPQPASVLSLTRLTVTAEQALNLNPTLSDDGKIVAFESTADSSFHAVRADLNGEVFEEIGRTRAVSPAMTTDGRIVVFSSMEDLIGRNADRNSEIFLFDGSKVQQLTDTKPTDVTSRLSDGNFQPTVTADGRTIAFSSNRNLCGQNEDLSYEIFLYDTLDQRYTQLTNNTFEHSAESPKISADGSRVYYKTGTDDLVLIETQTTTRVLATGVPELSITEGRAISNDGMRLVYSALTAPNQTQVFLYEGRDNSIRQLTQLGSRTVDVKLQPTISGDGRRVAFATRRRVTNASDGGVELYVLDLPTGEIQQITNAPSSATAEVVASLNFDGSLVAFSFPRILSGAVSDDDFRNNSEIYLAAITPRSIGAATVLNAAAGGNEPEPTRIAPGSIAKILGTALVSKAEMPTVKVNGRAAQIIHSSAEEIVIVVPGELTSGPGEFLVTNAEGLSSKAEAMISGAAPGVFTITGDGRGDAIMLDADTLTTAPFDPSHGKLRLSIFATGVTQATNVSVTINAKPALVEAVSSTSFSGLDQINVLVPADLRGAGRSVLIVNADGVNSNLVSVLISGSPSPTPTPTPTPSSSPTIVISQVFGGGGNSGSPFRNDFIEIFNRGNTSVNLSGWSVQYASATASTWSVTPLTSVTLLPGQYYLIQESSGGSSGVVLSAPDATGTIAMAAGSGKVALVKSSTVLSGTCPNDPNIVDLVGYGSTANCFRGSVPAPAASNTNAILRAANGCTDTRNNNADFMLSPPNPRNISSLPRICAN
ncbi:MAG TPA: lamin tail domain-containing protein [Pyrinomonadaceae bacterium]|nr:lamin tail domain-containing protein [Pyrinomonadaceae bacterium]